MTFFLYLTVTLLTWDEALLLGSMYRTAKEPVEATEIL
jgi:hypothetical protein